MTGKMPTRRQLLGAKPVPARGGMKRVDAGFGLAQRLGIELDARGIVAQLAHRFARLGFGRFEHLYDGAQARVVFRQ